VPVASTAPLAETGVTGTGVEASVFVAGSTGVGELEAP